MHSLTSSSRQAPAGPTVLLVEDAPDMAAEILAKLRREGYVAIHAASGPEGLAACIAAPPNLLVADRTLPGFDGLTLIKTLRSEGSRVPVLVLSALFGCALVERQNFQSGPNRPF
jgi:two-component system, OmpR family, response regulator